VDKFNWEVIIQIFKKKKKMVGIPANKQAGLNFEPEHRSWPAPLLGGLKQGRPKWGGHAHFATLTFTYVNT
jgi:hypothetical protein